MFTVKPVRHAIVCGVKVRVTGVVKSSAWYVPSPSGEYVLCSLKDATADESAIHVETTTTKFARPVRGKKYRIDQTVSGEYRQCVETYAEQCAFRSRSEVWSIAHPEYRTVEFI